MGHVEKYVSCHEFGLEHHVVGCDTLDVTVLCFQLCGRNCLKILSMVGVIGKIIDKEGISERSFCLLTASIHPFQPLCGVLVSMIGFDRRRVVMRQLTAGLKPDPRGLA